MIENILFQLATQWATLIFLVAVVILAWKFKSPILWIMVVGQLLVLIGQWTPGYIFESFENMEYNEAGELVGVGEPSMLYIAVQYLQWIGIIIAVSSFLLFSLVAKAPKK